MKRFFSGAWGRFVLTLCGALVVSPEMAAKSAEVSLKDGCSWACATNEAPWPARKAHTAAVFNEKLWIIGGTGMNSERLGDVWYSPDGNQWIEAVQDAMWSPRSAGSAVVFLDKLWLLGGGIASGSHLNDVWYSEDGCTWTEAVRNAAWDARAGHACTVFLDKIWVLGGYYTGNDVWCSQDGVNWDMVVGQAPWSPRAWFSAVVFDNKLWVLGGASFEMCRREFNDVWCTEDGVYWTEITGNAPWPIRSAHVTLLHDSHLWILGGQYTINPCSPHSAIISRNDVWHSGDGLTWSQADAAPWYTRSGHASACFQDKLWILGGNVWGKGVQNDVWYAEVDHSAAFSAMPVSGGVPVVVQFTDESTAAGITAWNWDFGDGGTSDEQHPSHEYTVRGVYTVSLTVTAESGMHTETKQDYITACGTPHPFHSADTNQDNVFNLSELMRMIQFFNSGGFHCVAETEDGYAPGPGDDACALHDADYAPPDWQISLSELLRVIQLYNSRGYQSCDDGEDGFCPGAEENVK